MLTIARKVYLENYLNENYPENIDENVLNIWKTLFNAEEVAYLYRAYFLPLDMVRHALSSIKEKNKLYKAPVINEAIELRIKEVPEILSYLDALLNTEQVYGKLVRDNIPDIIRKNGEEPVCRVLDDKSYWHALVLKDQEELEEVLHAQSRDEVCEELADKLEVLIAMAEYHDLTIFEVIQKEILKKLDRGGFSRKLYLAKVLPKSSDN